MPSENQENIQDPVPCENCGGTGKITGRPTEEGVDAPPASYGDGVCPVCGGSGKAPAPTVKHSEKNRLCFVATAAFGDPDCPELVILRRFRDEQLLPRAWGRSFVAVYYRIGPSLARVVTSRPRLQTGTRRILRAVCRYLSRH